MERLRHRPVPRIGVTGMRSNQIHGLRFDGNAASSAVLRAVVLAGGEPLTLFAAGVLPAEERLQGLDGLLVPGGNDVEPSRYGQEPLETTSPADFAEQDQFEADMMAAALRCGVPVLAICRGFQLLNVEQGGTLVQELPRDSSHRNSVHEVVLEPDSVLAQVLAVDSLSVSSYHHQALDRVGNDLRVVARASDGVVEALEYEGAELLAVQWHPEDTSATDERQHALFAWLVERARRRTEGRECAE